MAKVIHTCTGCVPIDASIIEAYAALLKTNQDASKAEESRQAAESERESTFEADHEASVAATERANKAAEAAENVGKYYGFFPTVADLPSNAKVPGYAMVGETSPFAIYDFDGIHWTDSGTTLDSIQGESAYQVAVEQGFVGTEQEWLDSLVGPEGDSAYEVAVEQGFVGTKDGWLASLVGPQGPIGVTEVEASVDDEPGEPSVDVTLEDQKLTLDFHGLKGATGPQGQKGDQGNSGYQGAAGELEVVNNDDDGGPTAAYSAERGKNLRWNIIPGITAVQNTEPLALSGTADFEVGNLSTSSGDETSSSANAQIRSSFIPIYPKANISFSAQNGYTVRVFEYKEDKTFNGYSGYTWLASGEYQTKEDSFYIRVAVNMPTGVAGPPVWSDVKLTVVPSKVFRFIPYADLASEKYAAIGGAPNTAPLPFVASDFEMGNISETDGKNGNASTTIRLKGYCQIYPGAKIAVASELGKVAIFEYKEDKTYIGWSQAIEGSGLYQTSESAFYIRIRVSNVGSSPDWSAIALSVVPDYLYEYVRGLPPEKIEEVIQKNLNDYWEIEQPILAPSPQLPANSSQDADFNAETMTSQEIQEAFENLLAGLPRVDNNNMIHVPPYGVVYEEVGRDATDQFDIKAYVFTRRNRNCYRAANALYAWVLNDTTYYTDHRSPRVGDAVYSDTERTATAYTVTAYNSAGPSITVNGNQYTRDNAGTVAADDIFIKSPTPEVGGSNVRVYDRDDNYLGNASITDIFTTLVFNGKNYTRRTSADYHTNNKATIFLWANEHGPQSDPNEPSIVLYRLAKDLCDGCRDNPFLSFLRGYCKVVMLPAANPYGINAWAASGTEGRQNGNGVNINRNYDTVGWAQQADTDKGAYAGSESETQYIMNTFLDFQPDVAVDIHCIGYASPGSQQILHWQGAVPAENGNVKEMLMAYCGLHYTSYGDAAPASEAFGPDWIYSLGIAGGLIEMTAGPYALSYNGKQHTGIFMFDDYTFLLNVIRMWYSQFDPTLDLRRLYVK